MRNGDARKDRIGEQPVQRGRKRSLRRLSAGVGAALAALILAGALIIVVFGGAILNGYGKPKAERAFAAAHPGCALRIGELNYALGANRLRAQSVTVSATNATLRVGPLSLSGVHWVRLLRGTAALVDVFAQANLDATNLNLELPQAHYGIRCARLQASVPESELIAAGTELGPLAGDEAFFAAHPFRTPRFHVVLPECRVSGLAYGEALEGKSYRAGSVHFSSPFLDALLNRDKPPRPFVTSPLMAHEALASIRPPLHVGSVTITNGQFRYCEQLAVGAEPAVLTFGAVSMSVEGIANRSQAAAIVQLRGQGDLMNSGTLKVLMKIPVNTPDFSLHYSGSLGAMDLTRLDAFLNIAEHIRIKSGSAQEAAFDIHVTAGQASGHVRAVYENLEIAVLDKQTGSEDGLDNHLASFLANNFKFRNSNAPDAKGSMKEGEVSYTRRPEDEFLQYVWFALRTGVLDVISR